MFGERIKQLRQENKLSMKDLSKILGVSDRAIGYYETEQRVPPQDILQKVADFFSVSVDYILGRTSVKTSIVKELDSELSEGFQILNEANKYLSRKEKKMMIDLMKAFIQTKDK